MVCSADWFAMDELDPRLIRMLARHFPALQGLRMVAIAVCLQTLTLVWLTTRSEGWTIVAGAVPFALMLAALELLDRYYARFGRVVMGRRYQRALFLAGPVITFLLPFPTSGFPNVVWTTLAFGALWNAWDCRPYRWHQLLVFVAMLYVAFGRVAYPKAGELAWMAPRMWAFASALVVAGLLDHRWFVRTMRQARAPAAEPS